MALAELDGEAEYRVLINDVLIGTATNPRVDEDYTPVRHVFEQVVVPEGATIAVESLANTNGLIPEGDGTAYARGRWTALELANDNASTGPEQEVDLQLQAEISPSSLTVGESATLSISIRNESEQTVATQPRLAITRPRAEVSLVSEPLSTCSEIGNDIVCELSEIAPGEQFQADLQFLTTSRSPKALIRATITTDQLELTPDDNVVLMSVSVLDPDEDIETDEAQPPADSDSSEESPDPTSEDSEDDTTTVDKPDTDISDGYEQADENTTHTRRRSGSGAVLCLPLLLITVLLRRRPVQVSAQPLRRL